MPVANGTPCVDDELCTGDDNTCTDEVCMDGAIAHVDDDTNACDDGDACTQGDICFRGACLPGAGLPPGFDDGNVCTEDLCVGGDVTHPHADGLACDDTNVCTLVDTCRGGQCVGSGAPAHFDDHLACTDDICDPRSGDITHIADDANECDDGNSCTTPDRCDNGICVSGAPPVGFDDNNPCTDNVCADGKVTHPNDDTNDCSDDDACTPTDACRAGRCIGSGTLPGFDDGKDCTDDACANGVVTHTNDNSNVCSDGSLCTRTDACLNGTCVGSGALAVADTNPCTDDSCDPIRGAVNTVDTSNACDDGDTCTTNVCDAGGACVVSSVVVLDDGNPCTDDSCTAAGSAAHTPNNSNSCSDGLLCTVGDHCASGGCVPGAARVCASDNDACTVDACNPGTGACTYDGSAKRAQCAAADANPCSDDGCDPGTGACTLSTVAADAACAATSCGALCDAGNGQCTTGFGSCDDGEPCTTDSCDAGSCEHVTDPLCTSVELEAKGTVAITGGPCSPPVFDLVDPTLVHVACGGQLWTLDSALVNAPGVAPEVAKVLGPTPVNHAIEIAQGLDGTLYLCGGGGLDAVDPASRATRWTVPYPYCTSVAVHGDGSVVSIQTGVVRATWPDGVVRWVGNDGSGSATRVAIGGDGTVYTYGASGVLSAWDIATGASRWTTDTGGSGGHGLAVLGDGRVVVNGLDGLRIYDPVECLDSDCLPTRHWGSGSAGDQFGGIGDPIVGPTGLISVLTTAGELQAFDPTTGLWRWTLEGCGPANAVAATSGHLVQAGGTIYATCADGAVVALASTNGEIFDTFAAGLSFQSIALGADGVIWVAAQSGELQAIQSSVHNGLALTDWPAPLRDARHTANGCGSCNVGATPTALDRDGDGVLDAFPDVCPFIFDPGQDDGDADGVGDACDTYENLGTTVVGVALDRLALDANRKLYVGAYDQQLRKIDPWAVNSVPSGVSELWIRPLASRGTGFGGRPPLIAADGTVYSHVYGSGFVALEPDGGEFLWTLLDVPGTFTGMALGAHQVIYGAVGNELRAVSGIDGAVLWTTALAAYEGAQLQGPVLAGDGTVIVVAPGNALPGTGVYGIDPESGAQSWFCAGDPPARSRSERATGSTTSTGRTWSRPIL